MQFAEILRQAAIIPGRSIQGSTATQRQNSVQMAGKQGQKKQIHRPIPPNYLRPRPNLFSSFASFSLLGLGN
jgi:hypothetical protein